MLWHRKAALVCNTACPSCNEVDSLHALPSLQEHARDSFENLLFSLCRFHELTGSYPEHLTMVSYDFKRARFLEVHRAALRWPEERMSFLGSRTLSRDAVQVRLALPAAKHLQLGLATGAIPALLVLLGVWLLLRRPSWGLLLAEVDFGRLACILHMSLPGNLSCTIAGFSHTHQCCRMRPQPSRHFRQILMDVTVIFWQRRRHAIHLPWGHMMGTAALA